MDSRNISDGLLVDLEYDEYGMALIEDQNILEYISGGGANGACGGNGECGANGACGGDGLCGANGACGGDGMCGANVVCPPSPVESE